MSKITVITHTYNAEQHLAKVLEALKGFDELLVVDMESTDSTVAIALENGAKVITFPKNGHTIVEPARNFGITQASNPWILEIDADEIVTPELKEYLYELIKSPDAPAGLYIPRRNMFLGRENVSGYPDFILRFFKKEGTNWPPTIHSIPTVTGRVDKIPARRRDLAIIHLADESISNRLHKIDTYTDNERDRRINRRISAATLLWRPAWRFFKSYVLDGGFRDGRRGIIKACFDGFYQTIVAAKIIETKEK